MTSEEENLALENAWDKIGEWVKAHCRFPRTRKFAFPHDVYTWRTLEVYPSGDCAVLQGSWGNPGEGRPTIIHGHETIVYSNCDHAWSWSSNEEDFTNHRLHLYQGKPCTDPSGWPRFRQGIESHSLLWKLYENWGNIKEQILAAVGEDKKLKEFKA